MLKYYGRDPDPELWKRVAGSGINHSGSTTLLLTIVKFLPKWSLNQKSFLQVPTHLFNQSVLFSSLSTPCSSSFFTPPSPGRTRSWSSSTPSFLISTVWTSHLRHMNTIFKSPVKDQMSVLQICMSNDKDKRRKVQFSILISKTKFLK